MYTIIICGTQRQNEIDERWINQEINRRRADDKPVCVKVSIETSTVKMSLASEDCKLSGTGFHPSPDEKKIIDCWYKHHLNGKDFMGGNLIAFLKQIKLD